MAPPAVLPPPAWKVSNLEPEYQPKDYESLTDKGANELFEHRNEDFKSLNQPEIRVRKVPDGFEDLDYTGLLALTGTSPPEQSGKCDLKSSKRSSA
jgi:hypothetical protein